MRGIEVRWSGADDIEAVGNLLEFDGSSTTGGDADGRFIVAEEDGMVVGVVRVRAVPSRMDLWGFVADPRVGADEIAEETYRGASELAGELGVPAVWADDEWHRDALLAAGYRRRVGGWKFAGETNAANASSPSFIFGIFGS